MKKRSFVFIVLLIAVSSQQPAVSKQDVLAENNAQTATNELPITDNRQPTAIFDAQRAFAILEKQCGFGPRPPGSMAHRQTQRYLFTELQKYADSVVLQPHQYAADGVTLQLNNILAEFGAKTEAIPSGTAQGPSGDTLLLAAHWDTRPFADLDPKPENQNTPILGANDGASGVAVLLEIARVLSLQSTPASRCDCAFRR